jgi:hypothetical protein
MSSESITMMLGREPSTGAAEARVAEARRREISFFIDGGF